MKVGVIGLGSMGQNHVRVLSEMGLLEGVADIVPAVAKSTGKRFSVGHYANYHDLLKRNLDAVVVVTPTTTHKKIASEVMLSGKHLLLEKPMTGSSKDLSALAALAERRKVVMAGGFTERHNPVVEFAYASVQSEAFGGLITASTRRVSPTPTRISDVGVVMDLGIHDIDVLHHITADRPRSVYALGGISKGGKYEDHASILIDFSGGATGFVEVNWLTPIKVRKLVLTCSRNFVEADYMDQSALVCSSSFKPFEVSDLYNVPIEFDMRRVALKKEEPLKREMRDFLESVEQGSLPLVTGQSVTMTLKIAEAALRSMRTGSRQAVR